MRGRGRTKQGMGIYMSGVDGWLGGAEMESLIQGTPARGGFSLGSVASVQRRRHLASWNATGRGGGAEGSGRRSLSYARVGEGCNGDYLQ